MLVVPLLSTVLFCLQVRFAPMSTSIIKSFDVASSYHSKPAALQNSALHSLLASPRKKDAFNAVPGASVESIECPECGKLFRGVFCKYNLEKHRSIHAGIRSYQCTICDKAFVGYYSKYNLKKHMDSVHFLHDSYQCLDC